MTVPTTPTRARRAWRFLMTPVGRRVPVGKNGAPHGVALMTVLLGLALMSAVVTDLGANEMIRYRLAVNDRDALRAQALSESALNMSRLLLSVQAAVQPMITQLAQLGIPLPAHTIWQLVPMDSDTLKGLTSGELQSAFGMDVSASLEKRKEEHATRQVERVSKFDEKKAGIDDENILASGAFEPPEGGFGAFEGSFEVTEIVDEEQKVVSLRGWATGAAQRDRFERARRLNAVFQDQKYDFLFEDRDTYGQRTDRAELTANIYDWMDDNEEVTDSRADEQNWGRTGAGSEEALYTTYGKVRPKDAYFDSAGELSLVRGWSDAHQRAFGGSISIYGEGGKVNIMSAPPDSIAALIYMCAANPQDPHFYDPAFLQQAVPQWNTLASMGQMLGGYPRSADGFVAFLRDTMLLEIDETVCKASIGTESTNFTVRATATVGDVTRTMTTVLRVYQSDETFYYYAVR